MDRIEIEDKQPHFLHLINEFIEKSTLVRLSIIKDRGVKFNMPCRILHLDAENKHISVYNVDEKQVYLFSLNEIDDLVV